MMRKFKKGDPVKCIEFCNNDPLRVSADIFEIKDDYAIIHETKIDWLSDGPKPNITKFKVPLSVLSFETGSNGGRESLARENDCRRAIIEKNLQPKKGHIYTFYGEYKKLDDCIEYKGYYFPKSQFQIFANKLIYIDPNYQDLSKDYLTGQILPKHLMENYIVSFNYKTGEEETVKSVSLQGGVPFINATNEPHDKAFLTEEHAIKSGFKYGPNTDYYFHETISKSEIAKWKQPRYVEFKNRYNAPGKPLKTTLISGGLDYSFGVELETSSGMLPQFKMSRLNVGCCRDGSITGGEYVTGVLKGDQGFFELKEICQHLSLNCEVDHNCGLHVHIGGANFNKIFSLAMYKVGLMLQDEIFSMMPLSRLKTRNEYYKTGNGANAGRQFGSSCGKLPDLGFTNFSLKGIPKETQQIEIMNNYKKLYSWLLTGDQHELRELNRNTARTRSHNSRYPLSRYVWLNLIPCNFSKDGTIKNLTVEFRNHSGTINYLKIKNWTLICMAITNYVENNKYSLFDTKSLTLKEVLSYSFKENKLDRLLEYVEKRKSMYISTDANQNATVEDIEYKNDTIKQIETFTKKQLIQE